MGCPKCEDKLWEIQIPVIVYLFFKTCTFLSNSIKMFQPFIYSM